MNIIQSLERVVKKLDGLVKDSKDTWSPEARKAALESRKRNAKSKAKIPGTPGQASHEQMRISNILSRVNSKKDLNSKQKKDYISKLVSSRAHKIGTAEKMERFAKALESAKLPNEAKRVRAIKTTKFPKSDVGPFVHEIDPPDDYNEKASKRALKHSEGLEKKIDSELKTEKEERLKKTLQYLKEKKEKKNKGFWM